VTTADRGTCLRVGAGRDRPTAFTDTTSASNGVHRPGASNSSTLAAWTARAKIAVSVASSAECGCTSRAGGIIPNRARPTCGITPSK